MANSRNMAKCWLNFLSARASLKCVWGEDRGVKISQDWKVVFVTKLTMHVNLAVESIQLSIFVQIKRNTVKKGRGVAEKVIKHEI